MLLARKAEQIGMRMTDDEITRFLQMLTNNSVTAEQFSEILTAISGRRGGTSRRQLYNALRTELLAQRFGAGFLGQPANHAAERSEAYQKLNSRASIEAIPVAVADFLDKVPSPTLRPSKRCTRTIPSNSTRHRLASTGYEIPAKVAVQYMVDDFEQFENAAAVTNKGDRERIRKKQDARSCLHGRPRHEQHWRREQAAAKSPMPMRQPATSPTQPHRPADGATPATPESAEKPASDTPSAEESPEPKASNEMGSTPQSRLRRASNSTRTRLRSLDAEICPATRTGQRNSRGSRRAAPRRNKRCSRPRRCSNQPAAAEAAPPTDAATGDAATGEKPADRAPPGAIRWKRSARRSAPSWHRFERPIRCTWSLPSCASRSWPKYGNERTRWK